MVSIGIQKYLEILPLGRFLIKGDYDPCLHYKKGIMVIGIVKHYESKKELYEYINVYHLEFKLYYLDKDNRNKLITKEYRIFTIYFDPLNYCYIHLESFINNKLVTICNGTLQKHKYNLLSFKMKGYWDVTKSYYNSINLRITQKKGKIRIQWINGKSNIEDENDIYLADEFIYSNNDLSK